MSTAVAPVREFSPAALRAARQAAGRSQKEVATAIGLRKLGTIAEYEFGRRSPRADDLAVIAEFLGVDVLYFYPLAET
jgi:transcriptional regulator with XRE-family HTH domain